MKLRIEVGKRIRQIRDALNLTQEDFGKSIGSSKASLSEIEKGKYKAGIELLENLVKKYNVNLHFAPCWCTLFTVVGFSSASGHHFKPGRPAHAPSPDDE